MRRMLRVAVLLMVVFLNGCRAAGDAIGGVNEWLAERRFDALCKERAGLESYRRVELGGVRSNDSNLGQNLWLLFDFNAPFVEFERRYHTSDELLVREWGSPPEGASIWRIERRPLGDGACATFEAWLKRVAAGDFHYDALPGRWRERTSYGDACLSLTFRASSDRRNLVDSASHEPRYFLQRDSGRIERIGCHDATEQRYAVTDRWGTRVFVVNSLRLTNFRCLIGGPAELIAQCGDPIGADLSMGLDWFVDSSSPAARDALAAEEDY